MRVYQGDLTRSVLKISGVVNCFYLLETLHFFLLDVSSQLFNKLMIITSYNMIKMGGVIQGEITRLVLRISGVINYFYLLGTLHFCLVYVHVHETRC